MSSEILTIPGYVLNSFLRQEQFSSGGECSVKKGEYKNAHCYYREDPFCSNCEHSKNTFQQISDMLLSKAKENGWEIRPIEINRMPYDRLNSYQIIIVGKNKKGLTILQGSRTGHWGIVFKEITG